ncbi:MAG TPA: hypothetical protein VEG44_07730 [Candidatus Acidoferrales bacterium]|nr:hypothetical protein [Candidatus Acidoferrales bacterium]
MSHFCLEVIIVAVNDVKGGNVTTLEDLVEIEPLILVIDLTTLKGGR